MPTKARARKEPTTNPTLMKPDDASALVARPVAPNGSRTSLGNGVVTPAMRGLQIEPDS